MTAMRSKFWRWLVVGLFSCIPLAWLGLASLQVIKRGSGQERYLGPYGIFTRIEEQIVDWMYRLRGEKEIAVPVVYVDVDSQSIADLGNFPWDRGWFAEVVSALTTQGGVSAVGLDFLFSSKGQPAIFRDLLLPGNRHFAEVLESTDRAVLAASYTSAVFRRNDGGLVTHNAPLLFLGQVDLSQIDPPEVPELQIGYESGMEGVARPIYKHPRHLGLIDTLDGGVRWVPAFTPTSETGRPMFHLSVELAARVLGVNPDDIRLASDRIELRRPDGTVARTIPLHRRQLLEVNWFTRWGGEQNLRISFSDVLVHALALRSEVEAEREIAREFFKQFAGMLVLIGPVDPFMQDISPTPLDPLAVPRVGIHGNLVQTIVSGAFIQRPGFWGLAAITLGLTGLITWLATADSRYSRVLKISGLFVVAIYIVSAQWLFEFRDVHLPLVVPLGAAFTTSFLAAIVQLVNEQQQKGRIRTMFSTYAPAQVVDRLIESGETPRLGGAKAEITAFFSDIQGFSTIAEQLEPEELVEIMNEYLTTCTDAVYHESGLLDKYVGDAVVAMFGGLVSIPDHATRACAAAMLVQKRQRELCDRWKAAGRKFPDSIFWMRTRIGLNTGPAIVGNLGSRQRFTYTMMGDTVNLASRLEGACKYLGVYILVSQSVRDAVVANGGGFVFRKLDRIEVVGRVEPLDVYELMCAASELTDADEECLSRFSRARALYEQRRWDEAEKAFEACAHFERFQPGRDPEVHGNASLVFVQRCRILRANPTGAEWDGVFRLTEK